MIRNDNSHWGGGVQSECGTGILENHEYHEVRLDHK